MASFAKTLAAVVIRGCCLESRDRDRNCAPPLEAQVGAIQGVAVARLAGCGLGRRGRAGAGDDNARRDAAQAFDVSREKLQKIQANPARMLIGRVGADACSLGTGA